jgi:transcriptional regulator with XRE-family HTH domain
MSRLGRRIREVRRRLGLTQIEFAERLETTQGSVSRWESGDQWPGFPFLMKIGEMGGLDPIKFAMDEEEHPYRSSDAGREVAVLAAIEWDHWSERVEWDEHDRFITRIPTLDAWSDLVIIGFVVRDDSVDLIYPKDSVVFAAILPNGSWKPPSPYNTPDPWGLDATWRAVTPLHGDLVIVLRRSPGGLVELTAKKYYVAQDGGVHLTPLSENPKFAFLAGPPNKPKYEPPTSYPAGPEIIGIVVGSFTVDVSSERFKPDPT